MSKPVFQDLFAFEGRRNRKSYVFYILSLFAITLPIGALIGVMGPNNSIVWVVMLVIYIPLAISSLAVGSQRCRDCGWTGWLVLLGAIPYVGIIFALVLLFYPGTAGDNKYGYDHLQQAGGVTA
ncbi:DUF805 domain-containing protein [Pseudophaeobacter sp.]|uniref:DUF805 domain-containing protein n=1 Tax=Pseudophaeobacter sp. TaxID=1971739 RepID=UPI003298BF7E